MNYLALFFAGAFLCNSLPHLASGLQGELLPTPFATPRGVGMSSPLLNFCWGFFNLVVGLCLLALAPPQIGLNPEFLVLLAGVLALGLYLAPRFGRVKAQRRGG